MPLAPADVTVRQIVAARALLDWRQVDLADKAGVAQSTIADYERGHRTMMRANAAAIVAALTAAGIEFIEGGVRVRAMEASTCR